VGEGAAKGTTVITGERWGETEHFLLCKFPGSARSSFWYRVDEKQGRTSVSDCGVTSRNRAAGYSWSWEGSIVTGSGLRLGGKCDVR
jgi:hypothetical protein